jgi:pimeloyl-ACP methyl ester carboxylesterase
VLGYSALVAGFAFLPGALFIIGGAAMSSRLVSHVGPRRLIVIGGLLSAVALWWFSRLPASGNYAEHLLVPMLLVCFGMGMSMVPLTVAATSGVDRSEAGLASGLLNTTRQVGGALGLAALSTIAADRSNGLLAHHVAAASAATSGFDRAFVVGMPPAESGLKMQPVVELAPSLSCPLLGLFGADDKFPSPAHVAELADALRAAGKDFEFHSFDGAGHGFFAVDRPSYRVDAANQGWEFIFDFFGRHLAA